MVFCTERTNWLPVTLTVRSSCCSNTAWLRSSVPPGNCNLKIALLTGFDSLPVFAIGVDHPGIQTGFASHDEKAAMAIDVSQVGQIQIAPVRQQHITAPALGLRPVVVFGISVGTQGHDDRGILKQIQGAQWSSTAAGLTALKRPGKRSAKAW